MKTECIRTVVRGVIVVDSHVLVAHSHYKGTANTFLPGGHVEFGESLTTALIRELVEEVGLHICISSYLGMVEHRWTEDDRQRHQINHVFAARLADVTVLPRLESREAHLEFFWVPPSELPKYNLMPAPLLGLVQHFLRDNHTAFWDSTFATLNASS